MYTIGKQIKEKAKENGLKMYEVAMLMNIGYPSFNNTYMHSNDETKLKRVIKAIDDYVKGGNENV